MGIETVPARVLAAPRAVATARCLRLAPWPLVAVVAGGAGLRAALWPQAVQRPLVGDDASYAWQALRLLAGDWVAAVGQVFPPGYAAAIVLVSPLTGGDLAAAAYLVSVLASLLLIPVLFYLTRPLYGEQVALVAALLTAIYPRFLEMGLTPLSEMLYTLLLASVLLFTLALQRAIAQGRRVLPVAAGTGALVGAAYLTRPEGLVYLGPLGLCVLLAAAAYRRWRAVPLAYAGVALGLAPLVLPYVLYLHGQLGQWTISGKLGNLAQGTLMTRGADLEAAFYRLTPDGTRLIVDSPEMARNYPFSVREFVAHYARNLYDEQLVLVQVLPLPILLVTFLGCVRGGRPRQPRLALLTIGSFVLVYVLLYPAFFLYTRYFVPLVALVIPWLAVGTLELRHDLPRLPAVERHAASHALYRSVPVLGVALVLLGIAAAYRVTAQQQPTWKATVAAGRWLADNGYSAARVMAVHGAPISFYGRLRQYALMTPYAEYPDLVRYARYKGVALLVVEERFLAARPVLRPLLDWHQPPAGLQPVFQLDLQDGNAVVIYALR
ncbi:MAG TPA: glycosyltransferase family 39 protein [Chloroflexota bacterium]|nr:glycosyltransferase family 39 protein [Chloroflexota bacterium]